MNWPVLKKISLRVNDFQSILLTSTDRKSVV